MITKNRIVLSFKDRIRKPLRRRPMNHHQIGEGSMRVLRGLPCLTSTNFWDFLTPSSPPCLQNLHRLSTNLVRVLTPLPIPPFVRTADVIYESPLIVLFDHLARSRQQDEFLKRKPRKMWKFDAAIYGPPPSPQNPDSKPSR